MFSSNVLVECSRRMFSSKQRRKGLEKEGTRGVAELAESACMCERHLRRKTKEKFGLPPHRLLENIRLAKAIEAIHEQPEVALFQISQIAGYASYKSFYQAFTRRLKVTPSEAKQHLKQNPSVTMYALREKIEKKLTI
ncbi:MAG TPA: helix-turn-helix domain-containing protein, partial [bacterium]|nr:helix-turn-helix domain-containing protein [bacterium]HNH29109.1 helix-turn-helix domain-containing protein [bacterium]